MDYPGKVITKNAVIPTQTSAPGVWTLDDAAQAQKANSWPIPGVLNPISKSLRFNSADSAYLNRTPSVAGNRRTWTWSGWVKRSAVPTDNTQFTLFSAGTTGGDCIMFSNEARLSVQIGQLDVGAGRISANRYRDPGSYYHIVVAIDTTQASDTNRVKMWVNNQQITTFDWNNLPAQNFDGTINNTVAHNIGRQTAGGNYYSGYMTEVNFVDGQALTPSDFGMTDTVTGVWVPKKYTGTYGTNGFYVNFKDSTNTTTLGYDYSGNGNNWNANNFSVTAGAGNDSLTDVPTQWVGYSVTGAEAGGVIRGNYATWNPLNTGSGTTLVNGNLQTTINTGGGVNSNTYSTIEIPSSIKTYAEFQNGNADLGGVAILPPGLTTSNGYATGIALFYFGANSIGGGSAKIYVDGSLSYDTSANWSGTDILGVAVDRANSKVWFSKNGTWLGSGTQNPETNSGGYAIGSTSSFYAANKQNSDYNNIIICNFGQRPFAYTPPSGYKSLCTTNLPTPTIVQGDDYFNAALYTGNNTTNVITGLGFGPDLVWIKSRSNAENNLLFDTNRGRGYGLYSNLTNAEAGPSPSDKDLVSFDSDGFTLGQIYNFNVNDSGKTFVGWCWRASDSAAVTNTAGTITSTVSANTTSGFSVVTYTGTGSNATVGHGLGVAPQMIIVKSRSYSDIWPVYHQSIGNTQFLRLQGTNGAGTFNVWQNTNPTSSVFYISTDTTVNTNTATYVAYCFAPVAGYSAFGTYNGNGSSDGPFIYTGFRPAFMLVKQSSATGEDWWIYDNKRDTYNIVDNILAPNLSGAEISGGTYPVDFLSNGWKIRGLNALLNTNGATYVYAAFAESPFKFANAR